VDTTRDPRPTGPQIRKARLLVGLSQRQLAEAAGVQRETVTRAEAAIHPAPALAARLLAALERQVTR
jgi:transcriptional regulator with XRE-family HTH domain